jgi:hypothetical protein
MAPHNKKCLLDDKIVQELYADQLPDAPSDCETDKSSDDDDSGPSTSQKGSKMAKLEVSNSDVNIDDDVGDVHDGCIE